MTKHEVIRRARQADRLVDLGFTIDEADKLRRISATLTRWFERECGDSNASGSWAIERDENGDGKPYLIHHHYRHGHGPDTVTRTPIPDRERGARRRLGRLLGSRNTRRWVGHVGSIADIAISAYIQTDPRGCALYLLRPGDVPEGTDPASCYSHGIAVY